MGRKVKKGRDVNFEKRLRILHEVGNDLSRSDSINTLCRRVVELGRGRLGFDRLSIWFVDRDPRYITGSYGVNEKGRLRYEIGERVLISGDPAMRKICANRTHSVLETGVPLRDHQANAMGFGSHAIAAIWNGKEIVGYLSTDNLLKGMPITDHDRDVLELFAATFGHLYSLKKTEEELHNAYSRLKEMQYKLIQSAKMEVVGELASGVAHEVKNPLGIILGGVEYLSEKVASKDGKVKMMIQKISDAVMRADNIVKGLLDFSKLSKLDLESHNLNKVINDSILLIKHQVDKRNIAVVRRLNKNVPKVNIDKNKVEQVCVNLMMNAINSMPDGGTLTVLTRVDNASKKRRYVIVEITDTGSGIPEEILGKIFEPFFTTRRNNGGTGLGLSIVRTIIDMHGGKISIGNRQAPQKGARVMLKFKVN